ncbi:MAG: nickel pincer cofactor biosynthesis protein LarB [Candidatus Obscuribacter sp.]|nr:nickel pincer cofactor biosynthesis protein LarB [Candidatus Obscuribacter sp.]
MDKRLVEDLLTAVKSGQTSSAEALEQLKQLPYAELDFAKPDTLRALKFGLAEVIFAPGKSVEQIVSIAAKLRTQHKLVLATRVEPDLAQKVLDRASQIEITDVSYLASARSLLFGALPEPKDCQPVAVLTAGTADIPVAEEALLVLQAGGYPVRRIFDVGVAGLHRLLGQMDDFKSAPVVIVVAGMDGALASVVAGLVSVPVIAVPTSVGYGAGAGGLAPLLTMLNSCAQGLTVVNIDNGFGAGAAALRILNSATRPPNP